jgi:hypothetical protein
MGSNEKLPIPSMIYILFPLKLGRALNFKLIAHEKDRLTSFSSSHHHDVMALLHTTSSKQQQQELK